MLIRLAALGALGYFGYRYLVPGDDAPSADAPTDDGPPPDLVAGGPLSGQATLQHSPDLPPG